MTLETMVEIPNLVYFVFSTIKGGNESIRSIRIKEKQIICEKKIMWVCEIFNNDNEESNYNLLKYSHFDNFTL